ncbi:hypothetical protein N2152v2_004165 [Parachlorella kessleri]
MVRHHCGGPWRRRQLLLLAPHVTNEGKEMQTQLPERAGMEDEEYIVVDPENIFWNRPELGNLNRRVGLTYEDGLFEGEVDPVAEEYWFNEPPGGWQTAPRKLRKTKEEPVLEFDSVSHPGDGRTRLGAVQEGQVFQGMITKVMLYHGAQVDIGAEFDGLIPILDPNTKSEQAGDHNPPRLEDQKDWTRLLEALDVGTALEVRVHKVRDPALFRFPIQLVPTDATLAALPNLIAPDAWEAPMDLRDVKLSLEELATISGREWEPQRVELVTDYALKEAEGMPQDFDTWTQVSDAQLEALDRLAQELHTSPY